MGQLVGVGREVVVVGQGQELREGEAPDEEARGHERRNRPRETVRDDVDRSCDHGAGGRVGGLHQRKRRPEHTEQESVPGDREGPPPVREIEIEAVALRDPPGQMEFSSEIDLQIGTERPGARQRKSPDQGDGRWSTEAPDRAHPGLRTLGIAGPVSWRLVVQRSLQSVRGVANKETPRTIPRGGFDFATRKRVSARARCVSLGRCAARHGPACGRAGPARRGRACRRLPACAAGSA